MFVCIILLGNLLLGPSFVWSFLTHVETAHAAPRKSLSSTSVLVPLDPTVAAVSTTTATFTVLATLTPTVIPTPIIIPTPTALPDVGISLSNADSTVFQPGQTITYTLNVSSTPLSGPIGPSQFVKVADVFPIGLENVKAMGTDWAITTTFTTSPVVIGATYRGFYPIAPGTVLPPIIITGTVSDNPNSSLTCTAVVGVSGDANPDNNLANNTIFLATSTSSARDLAAKLRRKAEHNRI